MADLKKLLKNTLQGRALLWHDKTKSFENIHRKQLVNIISMQILETKSEKTISYEIYQKWINEILHLFPQEKKSVYLNRKSYVKGSLVKKRLSGKLPDRVHNLKRKYRQNGVITYRKHRQASSNASSLNAILKPGLWRFPDEFENNIDAEGVMESLVYLKSLSHAWATTEKKWSETIHGRLQQLKNMIIHDYFTEYPVLKKPLGYQLLKSDFEFVYPASANGLAKHLPSIKKRIFDIASKKTCPNIKDLLNLIGGSEESSNLATFLLIPTLISLTTCYNEAHNKRWRPSKVEVRDGFITHVKCDAEIKKILSQRKKQLLDLHLTLQPFIIIVGPSLEEIETYYVVVDETMYVLPNILEAVDTCFKAIFMLNAEYPVVCHSTWMFIQAAFYKITISSDQMSTATYSLLGDLGILD